MHGAKEASGTICPICGQDTEMNDEGDFAICSHFVMEVDETCPYACGTDCPCEPVGIGTVEVERIEDLNKAITAFFEARMERCDEEASRWTSSFPSHLAALINNVSEGVSYEEGQVQRDGYVDLRAFLWFYRAVLEDCIGFGTETSWEQNIPCNSSGYILFWADDAAKCAVDFHAAIDSYISLLRNVTQEAK